MKAIEWIAEQRILEAIEQGKLDDLPGKGKPVELDQDWHLPPEVRLAYRILRNAGFVPPVLSLRKEIEDEVNGLRQYLALVERYAAQYRREMSAEDQSSSSADGFVAAFLTRRRSAAPRTRTPEELRNAYEALRQRARAEIRNRVRRVNERIRALHDEWLRETYRRELAGAVDLTRRSLSEEEFLAEFDRRVPPLDELS